MNYKMILKLIGRLLVLLACLLVIPLIVSFIYREPWMNSQAFIITIGLLLILGGWLATLKSDNTIYYAKEGVVIVSLTWILYSLFGGLPLLLSQQYDSLIDTFFEMSSGFTTSGSSIMGNVEALSPSILFWRSFTHLIGGMGVLVLFLAIIPKTQTDDLQLMKAEVPGPIFGKLVAKLSHSARYLYVIYLVMTAVLVIFLLFGKMNLFDALLHAFGTAGTGGFGIKNNSVAFYDSAYIDIVLSVGMIVFGVNFNLYYLILVKKVKEALSSEELKWYLGFIISAVVLIMINLSSSYVSLFQNFRDSFFAVSSIITTTGYSTADFGTWPLFSQIILLSLMFIGGMAGSTAGGLKVSRVGVMIKSAFNEIKQNQSPKRVIKVMFDNKVFESKHLRRIANYLFLYLMIFGVLVFVVSFDVSDLMSAVSAVAATFNNIGPGLGVVGPSSNFGVLSDVSKFALSLGMITGRLEILPMLVLFSPSTYRGKK